MQSNLFTYDVRGCMPTCAAAGPRHLGAAAPRLRAVYTVVYILYMADEECISGGIRKMKKRTRKLGKSSESWTVSVRHLDGERSRTIIERTLGDSPLRLIPISIQIEKEIFRCKEVC